MSSFPPFSLLFFMKSSFKFFHFFNLDKNSPPPKGGDGQNICPWKFTKNVVNNCKWPSLKIWIRPQLCYSWNLYIHARYNKVKKINSCPLFRILCPPFGKPGLLVRKPGPPVCETGDDSFLGFLTAAVHNTASRPISCYNLCAILSKQAINMGHSVAAAAALYIMTL